MILKIQGENINLERIIFVKPMKTIDFDIAMDKEAYEPGDGVELQISTDFKE